MPKITSKPHLTRQTKINLARGICGLYADGQYTIATCCEAVGIKYDTFKEWVQSGLSEEDIALKKYRRGFIKKVHELYLNAQIQNNLNYKELLKDKTRSGILERITGSKYIETQINSKVNNDGSASIALIKKTEKYIPPDTAMLIFVAKSVNIFELNKEVTDCDSNTNSFNSLTDEQLEDKLEELKAIIT